MDDAGCGQKKKEASEGLQGKGSQEVSVREYGPHERVSSVKVAARFSGLSHKEKGRGKENLKFG